MTVIRDPLNIITDINGYVLSRSIKDTRVPSSLFTSTAQMRHPHDIRTSVNTSVANTSLVKENAFIYSAYCLSLPPSIHPSIHPFIHHPFIQLFTGKSQECLDVQKNEDRQEEI